MLDVDGFEGANGSLLLSELFVSGTSERRMFPLGDIIASTIRIVLQNDHSHKVLRRQRRIDRHDFIMQTHHVPLTKKLWK